MRTIVVALGGNALLDRSEAPSVAAERRNAERAARAVSRLARGARAVVTHGNGPQVGHILLRSEAARGLAYEVPLDVAVAESEGEIGYIVQQAIRNRLRRPAVSLATQVVVDARDPGFARPSKPVGPWLDARAARKLAAAGAAVARGEHGWRRVVASPRPLRIVEADAVRALLAAGFVVIAAGGGGVPVVERRGLLSGVDAVVDKDLASARLAIDVAARELHLLTDVPFVFEAFGTRRERAIPRLTLAEARKRLASGELPAGSMGPKVEAAILFLEATRGGRAVIGSLGRPGKGTVLSRA